MQFLLQLLDQGDFCPLAFVVLILWGLGAYLVQGQPAAQSGGVFAAVTALITYCLYRLTRMVEPNAGALLVIVLRGLLAGGLTLGATWLVAPVYQLVARLYQQNVKAAQARARERQAEREQRLKEQQERQQRRRQQQEWERDAPERERAEREAERRRQAEEEAQRRQAKAETQAQRRREDVRFACQLLYDQLTREQRERFPPKRFAAYLSEYLVDEHSAEDVEERGRQLQAMINGCFTPESNKRQTFTSVAEIADHFQRRKAEIQQLDYDEATRDVLLVILADEEQAALRRLLSP